MAQERCYDLLDRQILEELRKKERGCIMKSVIVR